HKRKKWRPNLVSRHFLNQDNKKQCIYQGYSLIITRFASASRSKYCFFSTVTPTNCIVPPLNVPGVLYCSLTASPLSKPTQSPSPDNVNFPSCVFIGPCATILSFTYNFKVPIDSPYLPVLSLVNSTPKVYLPGLSGGDENICSGLMPRKL